MKRIMLLLTLLVGGCYTADLGPSDGNNLERCMRYCRVHPCPHDTVSLHKGRYCTCN